MLGSFSCFQPASLAVRSGAHARTPHARLTRKRDTETHLRIQIQRPRSRPFLKALYLSEISSWRA